jgi:ABC-type nitrate/sulfonate/bicarbonate transport system substrate-binding protein
MRPMRYLQSFAAVLLFLAAFAGARTLADSPVGNASAELQPLLYGQAYSAMQSIYSLPIVVAQRKGYFVREGLAFSIVMIPGGGDELIKALDNGAANLTHVATPFLIQSAVAGSDAVAIAAEFSNTIYSFVAKPEIASFDALKGRVVGMADETGPIAYSAWKLLAMHGVARSDVEVKTITGTLERLHCLEKNLCDAVPLGQPEDFSALARGYRLLGLSTEAVPAFLYTVTAARRSWAETHKDVVVRYIRSLADAFRFIRDPANREEVIKIAASSEGVSETSARQTLSFYFDPERHALPMAAEIDLAGMRQVVAFMAGKGAPGTSLGPAERFVDLRYLRAAGVE